MEKGLAKKLNRLGVIVFVGTSIVCGSKAVYKSTPRVAESISDTVNRQCTPLTEVRPYDFNKDMPYAVPLIIGSAVLARYGSNRSEEE